MGNFIFDQNFASTMHSFILYVWLDRGQFHHAEIVPIYVQGYKPTPATDSQRVQVLNRLTTLSKYRNTHILPSGAHGIIKKVNDANTASTQVVLAKGKLTSKLPEAIAFNEIKLIKASEVGVRYRLGKNLVNGSDFSRFDFNGEQERGFLFDRAFTTLNADNGQKSLAIVTDSSSLFGMQSFRRVYRKSTPVTVNLDVQVQEKANVKFYWQGRKTRQKLFDAFNKGKKNLIESIELAGKTEWQLLDIDFNSPRIGYKSYRVLLEFISEDNKNSTVLVDDFSLIEWHTAFTKSGTPYHQNTLNQQATHLGVNDTSALKINIK